MNKKILAILLATVLLSMLGIILRNKLDTVGDLSFDGQSAFSFVEQQIQFGPRISGNPGHEKIVAWLQDELVSMNWEVQIQEAISMGHPIKNIIAKRASQESTSPWVIFSAHYDTRIYADESQDPVNRSLPVEGANDGASGVALLLELARVIPNDFPGEVWLVFFDAEDNGRIDGWDWILGSRVFVGQLEGQPDAVVLVDMIGDADLNIFIEKNSDPGLTAEIWGKAAELGYTQYFIPVPKYRMLDDHIPFLQADIPAVDIIDFDYPYWHTTEDTLDKVSAESLKIVGDTLLAWLNTKR
jgi:Zn-dependent M28 family amino/carboxypeptidase